MKFSFGGEPWRAVIQWFADLDELSLVATEYPTGTFTYTDTHEYTPAEAIDVLNSVLLVKGWTLLRHDRLLIVANLDDLRNEIPATWVTPLSSPADLDKYGEYEILQVVFTVTRVSPKTPPRKSPAC